MKASIIEQEFLKAYDETADALFRYCYIRMADRERAKDVVQQTFTKTWEYVARGNHVDNLKAFLYRVARNTIIDLSRRKKEISLDLLMDEGFDIASDHSERLADIIEGKRIRQVLERLDVKYREAVMLRYIDDLTPKEIAAITGEHENTISVRIHRATQQLREILSEK